MATFLSLLPFILIAIGVIILIAIIASGYVKAPSDKAYVITGPRKTPKIFIGLKSFVLRSLNLHGVLLSQTISALMNLLIGVKKQVHLQ